MSADSDLQSSVAALATAVNSAVAEIQNLANQIVNLTNDPAVEAAAGQINTFAANLTAAVAAASPPAPAPAPTPSGS